MQNGWQNSEPFEKTNYYLQLPYHHVYNLNTNMEKLETKEP
jgi:hypothetical protein